MIPDPTAFLPLSPPAYGVLLTLGRESMHGYRIMLEFEARTGQEGVLLPGSLYNTISRLLRDELVAEAEAPDEETDTRRRYYCATALGRAVARAESERLASLLRLASAQHLLGDEIP